MVNKKGYIRTLEAVIAIILVLIFIFSVLPKKQTEELKTPREIDLTSDRILSEIQYNEQFRQCVIEDISPINKPSEKQTALECVNKFIESNKLIPTTLSYNITVCDIQVSNQDAYNYCKESDLPEAKDLTIYTKRVILSTTLTDLQPKKVKLYIWRKV